MKVKELAQIVFYYLLVFKSIIVTNSSIKTYIKYKIAIYSSSIIFKRSFKRLQENYRTTSKNTVLNIKVELFSEKKI